jgi:hypothetical protein
MQRHSYGFYLAPNRGYDLRLQRGQRMKLTGFCRKAPRVVHSSNRRESSIRLLVGPRVRIRLPPAGSQMRTRPHLPVPLEMKDRSGGLVFDTLLSAIRPVDRCCHLSRISGQDRRAPLRSALGVAASSPRTSQRKAGSDIAPLLQPRPTSSTEQRGRASRIPLGGVAGLPNRPELQGGAGEFQWISERPCRDVRQVPRGHPS